MDFLAFNVLENLAEPFASGIYAGVPEEMEMASCFPKLLEAEQRFGSVMKGLRKVGFKAGKVIGFPTGNQELVDRIGEVLGEHVHCNTPAKGLAHDGQIWRVYLEDEQVLEADELIVTCAGYTASTMLRLAHPEISDELDQLSHCSLVSVHCCYDDAQIQAEVDGFGFLIPRKESEGRALGILFSSNLFEGRAPAGKRILRVLMGGARNPDILPRSEDQLIDEAKATIQRYLGIQAEPEHIDVATWQDRLPNYRPGHQARLRRLAQLTEAAPPIHFLGSSFTGSGVALCIRTARELAESLSPESSGARP
jgi:oxygen-dependent protoporphyrinogen oxidase